MLSNLNSTRSKKIFSILLSYLVSLICLISLSSILDYDQMFMIFKNLDINFIFYSIFSLIIGYAFRIWRWKYMLTLNNANISFKSCLSPFLGSIALNNLLPLRAGDIIRAFLFPSSIGISKSSSVFTLLIERLLDFSLLLIIFTMGIIHFGAFNTHIVFQFFMNAKDFLVLLIILFIIITTTYLILSKAKPFYNYILKNNSYFFISKKEITNFLNYKIIMKLLILTLLVWIFEAGVFFFAAVTFNIEITPFIVLFVMSSATLSTLVPSAPGYFGSFHLAILFAFSFLFHDTETIASYSVYVHLLIWGTTSILGIIALLSNPGLFSLKTSRELS